MDYGWSWTLWPLALVFQELLDIFSSNPTVVGLDTKMTVETTPPHTLTETQELQVEHLLMAAKHNINSNNNKNHNCNTDNNNSNNSSLKNYQSNFY